MIITPAKFEDDYNALPERYYNGWTDLTNSVVLQPELWDLIRETLISLGYGATIQKIDAAIEVNSEGAVDDDID